jgi:hypothetical protein
LTHYKEKNCLVEGPLNNLQTSMIQFSKPKKTLNKAMEQFRRFEAPAMEFLNGPTIASDREPVVAYHNDVLVADLIPVLRVSPCCAKSIRCGIL